MEILLHKNESIEIDSIEIDLQVRLQAHRLGLTWNTGTSYLSTGYSHETLKLYLDLNNGTWGSLNSYAFASMTVISAMEWLNRHGIFIHGQVVSVSSDGINWTDRIFLHDSICVHSHHEHYYTAGDSYLTHHWKYIKSTYPEFKKTRTLTLDGKDITISEESYQSIKKGLAV